MQLLQGSAVQHGQASCQEAKRAPVQGPASWSCWACHAKQLGVFARLKKQACALTPPFWPWQSWACSRLTISSVRRGLKCLAMVDSSSMGRVVMSPMRAVWLRSTLPSAVTRVGDWHSGMGGSRICAHAARRPVTYCCNAWGMGGLCALRRGRPGNSQLGNPSRSADLACGTRA